MGFFLVPERIVDSSQLKMYNLLNDLNFCI